MIFATTAIATTFHLHMVHGLRCVYLLLLLLEVSCSCWLRRLFYGTGCFRV